MDRVAVYPPIPKEEIEREREWVKKNFPTEESKLIFIAKICEVLGDGKERR